MAEFEQLAGYLLVFIIDRIYTLRKCPDCIFCHVAPIYFRADPFLERRWATP
jgi:hypothetical protein